MEGKRLNFFKHDDVVELRIDFAMDLAQFIIKDYNLSIYTISQ